MLIVGQLRYTHFSFIIDNCCGLSKNINRCRQLLKIIMSNIEDSLLDASTDNKDAAGEVAAAKDYESFNSLNDNNLRRACSADNIPDARSFTCWNGEPYFPLNWNWPPVYSIPQGQYYWNNGPSYPVFNPYYSNNYGHFSGGYVNPVQANYYFHEVMPPPNRLFSNPTPRHLVSSQSVDSMQRRYCVRRNNSEESLPKSIGVNPKGVEDQRKIITLRARVETFTFRIHMNAEILKLLSKRYWEDVRKKKKSSKPGVEFTLMSYNVLAQDLINEHLYLYKNHNPRALQWERRWKNIFDEISKLKPDIMCLQEVQESHLISFYSNLESLGYTGIYKKRTGIRCDGCAIYYKTDKFKLVEYETVEFYQPNVDILNRDNIAIIAKFSPRTNPQSEFVVATTHLLYNPRRQDVRLAQTQLFLTEIERLSFHCKSRDTPGYWPIIITGDFNSTPDSAIYELITKGMLKYDHLSARKLDDSKSTCQGNVLVPHNLEITDQCQHARLVQHRQKMKNISRREEVALTKLHHSDKSIAKICTERIENPCLFSTGTLSHIFVFKSVYNHGDLDNVEGTTFQDKWLSVDYIFYSGKKRNETIEDGKLKLISRYRLPRKSELGSIKLPNSALGSDHLSLVAKFKLKV